MVLEFACGGELFTHMRDQGNLNEGDTRFFIGEIALLLQYLHDLSIAYRDLKPGVCSCGTVQRPVEPGFVSCAENILIDRQGHVKLTDFGFAKILGRESLLSALCSTDKLAMWQLKEPPLCAEHPSTLLRKSFVAKFMTGMSTGDSPPACYANFADLCCTSNAKHCLFD